MRRTSLCGVCLLLLVVSPSFLIISSLQAEPTEPKLVRVENQSSTGFITPDVGRYRDSKKFDGYTVIETYTNGTKVHYGMHIYLNDSQCPDVWANFTSWLPQNTTSQTSSSSTSFQPLTEGNLPTKFMDNNVTFIYGSNSTCYTTYEHPDNYQKYHPFQWDYPFALQGDAYMHLHLPVSLLNSWVNGNISDAIFIGISFLTYEAINAMTDDLVSLMLEGGGAICKKVSEEIDTYVAGEFGMPLIAVGYEIAAWAHELIEFLERIFTDFQRAAWVNQIVTEKFGGDGWNWHPEPFDLGDCAYCEDPFDTRLMTVYHWYHVRVFNMTWGTQGIYGNPETYVGVWPDYDEVKCGSSTATLSDYYYSP